MKILKFGKSKKIRFERKDGVKKDFEIAKNAMDYAKENLKEGDIVRATFKDGKIVKLQKMTFNKSKSYSGGDYNVPAERSALQATATTISGMEGVTPKNVVKVIDLVFSEYIRKAKTITKGEANEFSGGDTEFGGGEEEPGEEDEGLEGIED